MTGQGSNATIDFEPGAELLELVSRHDAIGRQFGEQDD